MGEHPETLPTSLHWIVVAWNGYDLFPPLSPPTPRHVVHLSFSQANFCPRQLPLRIFVLAVAAKACISISQALPASAVSRGLTVPGLSAPVSHAALVAMLPLRWLVFARSVLREHLIATIPAPLVSIVLQALTVWAVLALVRLPPLDITPPTPPSQHVPVLLVLTVAV